MRVVLFILFACALGTEVQGPCTQDDTALVGTTVTINSVAYELQSCIGRGSFGTGFKAASGGKPFAVKWYHNDGENEMNKEKALYEKFKASDESASHLIQGHGFGSAGGKYFGVMTLTNGDVHGLGKPTKAQYKAIIEGLWAGFKEFWAFGYVHRDAKPENTFYVAGSSGAVAKAYLADYGLAIKAGEKSDCEQAGTADFRDPYMSCKSRFNNLQTGSNGECTWATTADIWYFAMTAIAVACGDDNPSLYDWGDDLMDAVYSCGTANPKGSKTPKTTASDLDNLIAPALTKLNTHMGTKGCLWDDKIKALITAAAAKPSDRSVSAIDSAVSALSTSFLEQSSSIKKLQRALQP
jgi:serine/threonine protein kinase